MKKKFPLMFLFVFSLALVGCDNEDSYSQREEVYTFENMVFENDYWGSGKNAFIDTKEKTIAAPFRSLSFVKSNEETTLKVINHFYKGEVSKSRPTEYILYVSEEDLKEISKKYTNTFKSTIPVTEE